MNTKKVGWLLFGGIILSACSGVPGDFEDNWGEYIQDGEENLDSYASDTVMGVDVAFGPDLMTDEDEVYYTMYIEGDLEKGHSRTENQEGLSQELYFEGDEVYQLEEDEWIHYPDGGPIEYDSWYPHIVDSLLEVEELLEATHTEDDLTLTYEGYDQEVWNAFEQEFALSIGGISQDNIHITLNATLDESSYYLQDFSLDILGEETEGDMEVGSVSLIVEVEYYDHDEVDLSEVEEEVTAE